MGLPGGSDSKEYACNVGDPGSIPRSGRSPGEGNGNSLQYSCLENPMDRGAWRVRVHGVAKNQTRLRDFTHFAFYIEYKPSGNSGQFIDQKKKKNRKKERKTILPLKKKPLLFCAVMPPSTSTLHSLSQRDFSRISISVSSPHLLLLSEMRRKKVKQSYLAVPMCGIFHN